MAGVLMRQALDCGDPLTKHVMQHAAEDYARKAHSMERAVRSLEIVQLSSKASADDLLTARKQGAVRYSGRVYPPVALERHIVLPSILLRSALFSAASGVAELCDTDLSIVNTKDGKATLNVSGPRLNGHDRRVLGVCLDLYRGSGVAAVPLGQEMELSLHQFALVAGVAPGKHVYKSLLGSLERLSDVRCEISLGGVQLTLHRLLTSRVQTAASGTVIVTVRVDEDLSVLLRRGLWVSVPLSALVQYSGLPSWLLCFLRTQSEPYSLTHDYLQRLSGSMCGLAEFRRRLKLAIEALSEPNVDPYLRIGKTHWASKSVVFEMARWPEDKVAPQLRRALESQRRYSR